MGGRRLAIAFLTIAIDQGRRGNASPLLLLLPLLGSLVLLLLPHSRCATAGRSPRRLARGSTLAGGRLGHQPLTDKADGQPLIVPARGIGVPAG